MELRIELEHRGKRVEVTRKDWHFPGMSWLDQVAEIRRACEQAIGAFYADQIGKP